MVFNFSGKAVLSRKIKTAFVFYCEEKQFVLPII